MVFVFVEIFIVTRYYSDNGLPLLGTTLLLQRIFLVYSSSGTVVMVPGPMITIVLIKRHKLAILC